MRIAAIGLHLLTWLTPVMLAFAQHADPGAAPDAAAVAEARKLELAAGLQLSVWAAEPQLQNPVAFSLVPTPTAVAGTATNQPVTAYIAETHRYGISVLDITQNTPWLLNDLSFRTVEDRSRFLVQRFGTNAAILTRHSEQVRRVADTQGNTRADRSEVFATGFDSAADGTAAGVLARGQDVWFGNIPNLWRLGSGPSPTRSVLATGFGVHVGVTGHDLHGLVLGPDGRLYMSFGDRGLSITNREGLHLDVPDSGGVLRCEPDGRDLEIFCVGLRNPQELAFDDAGNLFTSDNDTAGADDCRVLHLVEGADYGWRASYQHMKGFGPWMTEGLWRGDVDGCPPPAGMVSQGPAGLAYYPGTGFGNRFEGQFVHCDFPGGVWTFALRPSGASFVVEERRKLVWNCWPTDVEFGPDGALYVLDWVAGWQMPRRGRIYRIAPNSVFAASLSQPRLEGADPDLFGGVYGVLRDGLANRTDRDLFQLLAHADYRVRLEAQFEIARRGRTQLQALAKRIGTSNDRRVRRHALWAMGQILRANPPQASVEMGEELAAIDDAATDVDPDTRVQALRVLGDFSSINYRRAVELALGDAGAVRVRFAAQLASARMNSPRHKVAIWASPRQRLLRRITEATGTSNLAERAGVQEPIGTDPSPMAGVLFATGTTSVEDRPFERFGTAVAMSPLPPAAIAQHLRERREEAHLFLGSRRAAVLALRRAAAPEIATALLDPDPRLTLEAARAINDVPIPEAYPALANLLEEPSIRAWGRKHAFELRPTHALGIAPGIPTNAASLRPARDQVLRRALNAHYRLGQATNAEALARFATGARQSMAGLDDADAVALRCEALFLLGAWAVEPAEPGRVPVFPVADPNHGAVPTVNPENWPGWFDRIVGLWRPLSPRPRTQAHDALRPVVGGLLTDGNPDVANAAIDAAVYLRITEAAPMLLARLRETATDIAVRKRVPRALEALDRSLLREAIPLALADPHPELQAAALPFLDQLDAGQAVPLLEQKILAVPNPTTPSDLPRLRLAQAAVDALGKLRGAERDRALIQALDAFIEGRLPSALELELLEAARGTDSADLRARLARRETTLGGSDALSGWRDVLAGGDSARGRTVFHERPEVQCSRCHKVRNEGGTVGPALDGIAGRQDRRYLLESMLLPNAKIAQGYETVRVTMSDDREWTGTVRTEDAETLVLSTVEEGEVKLPKNRIRERASGLSAMPEGLVQGISRRDLRDLLEYLASLKP